MTPQIRRHPALSTLAALLPAALLVAACAIGQGQPTTWLADDLLLDGDHYYVTCEASTDERVEKEVWVSVKQAAQHEEGAPCPEGDLRREPYTEAADDEEKKVSSVPKPKGSVTVGKPSVTQSGTRPPSRSSSATPTMTTTKRTTTTTTTTESKYTSRKVPSTTR